MKAMVGFGKRALIVAGGLLIGTAGFTLMPNTATAGNLIGVEVGPVSVGVGIGSSEPDDVAPAPAPAPSTIYVTPSGTSVDSGPPSQPMPAPVTTSSPSTTTQTTTTYGQGEPNSYPGYDPGLVPKGSETTTTYYPQ